MSPHHALLSWHHTVSAGLRLRIADRTLAGLYRGVDVPAEVTRLINHEHAGPDGNGGPGGHGATGPRVEWTADPAIDLIRLESQSRQHAAHLEHRTRRLRHNTDILRAGLTALTGRGVAGGLVRLRDRRRLAAQLRDAVDEFTEAVDAHEQARDHIRAVREFVIALDVPNGLLASARVGWLRDPTPPAFVSIFASERVFVIADPRRATSTTSSTPPITTPVTPPSAAAGTAVVPVAGVGRDVPVVAGERFGEGWRRDGDDDNPHTEEPAVIGPWQLGYIPTTGEVYASRRCRYLDEQVWLLARYRTTSSRTSTRIGSRSGTGRDGDPDRPVDRGVGAVGDPDSVRRLLADLQREHMPEPNSLIHAAHAVHNALHGGQDDGQRAGQVDGDLSAPSSATRGGPRRTGHGARHDTGSDTGQRGHRHGGAPGWG